MHTGDPHRPPVQPLRTPDGMVGCPRCGSLNINKPGFTWWGGVLGPKLLSHVTCNACGISYNGKTGKSNTAAIVIYSLIIGLLVFALVMAVTS